MILAWAAPAVAQVNLPTRQEVTPPSPDVQAPSTARVDARDAVPVSTCPFDGSVLRLTITRLEITRPDGSPLPASIAQSLAGLAAPAGEQPVAVVCQIRDDANETLRRAGWVASVQIPAQEIASNEPRPLL